MLFQISNKSNLRNGIAQTITNHNPMKEHSVTHSFWRVVVHAMGRKDPWRPKST